MWILESHSDGATSDGQTEPSAPAPPSHIEMQPLLSSRQQRTACSPPVASQAVVPSARVPE